jgi:hypothetical protein
LLRSKIQVTGILGVFNCRFYSLFDARIEKISGQLTPLIEQRLGDLPPNSLSDIFCEEYGVLRNRSRFAEGLENTCGVPN